MTPEFNIEKILLRIKKKLDNSWQDRDFSEDEILFFKEDETNNCLKPIKAEDIDDIGDVDRELQEELVKFLLSGEKNLPENLQGKIGQRKTKGTKNLVYYPLVDTVRVPSRKNATSKNQVIDNVEVKRVVVNKSGRKRAVETRAIFESEKRPKAYKSMYDCFKEKYEQSLNTGEYSAIESYGNHLSEVFRQKLNENSTLRSHMSSTSSGFNAVDYKKSAKNFVDLKRVIKNNLGDYPSLKSIFNEENKLDLNEINTEKKYKDLRDLLLTKSFEERSEKSFSLKDLGLDYFFKSLFSGQGKIEPVSGGNYKNHEVKIHQTINVIRFIQNIFILNENSYSFNQYEKIKQNIIDIDYSTSFVNEDYYILVNGFDSIDYGFNYNLRITAFLNESKSYKLIDVENPFLSESIKVMAIVSNLYTSKYKSIMGFLDDNLDIKNEFLTQIGILDQSFDKSFKKEDEEIKVDNLESSMELISKFPGLSAVEQQQINSEDLEKTVGEILNYFADKSKITQEDGSIIDADVDLVQRVQVGSSSSTIAVLLDSEVLKFVVDDKLKDNNNKVKTNDFLRAILNHSRSSSSDSESVDYRLNEEVRLPYPTDDMNVLEVDKEGNITGQKGSGVYPYQEFEVKLLDTGISEIELFRGTNSTPYGEVRSTRKDAFDRVMDQHIVNLTNYRDQLESVRKSIFDPKSTLKIGKKTFSQLRQGKERQIKRDILEEKISVKSFIVEVDSQEDKEYRQYLELINTIDRITGSKLQSFRSDRSSGTGSSTYEGKGSLVRSSKGSNRNGELYLDTLKVEQGGEVIEKTVVKTGLSIYEDEQKLTEIENDDRKVTTTKISLLSNKLVDELQKKGIAVKEIRENFETDISGSKYDGRIDYPGEIDRAISTATGGEIQYAIGKLDWVDENEVGHTSLYPKVARLPINRTYKASRNDKKDVDEIHDYRQISIDLNEVQNLHKIKEEDLQKINQKFILDQNSDPILRVTGKGKELVMPKSFLGTSSEPEQILKSIIKNNASDTLLGKKFDADVIDGFEIKIVDGQEKRISSTFLSQINQRVSVSDKFFKEEKPVIKNKQGVILNQEFESFFTTTGNSITSKVQDIVGFAMAAENIRYGQSPSVRELHHNQAYNSEIIIRSNNVNQNDELLYGEENDYSEGIFDLNKLSNFVDTPADLHPTLHSVPDKFSSHKEGNFQEDSNLPEIYLPVKNDRIAENNVSIESISEDSKSELEDVEYIELNTWSELKQYDETTAEIANESFRKISQAIGKDIIENYDIKDLTDRLEIESIEVKTNDTPISYVLPEVYEDGSISLQKETKETKKTGNLVDLHNVLKNEKNSVDIYRDDNSKELSVVPVNKESNLENKTKVGSYFYDDKKENRVLRLNQTEFIGKDASFNSSYKTILHRMINMNFKDGRNISSMQKPNKTDYPAGTRMAYDRTIVKRNLDDCEGKLGYWKTEIR